MYTVYVDSAGWPICVSEVSHSTTVVPIRGGFTWAEGMTVPGTFLLVLVRGLALSES